MLQLLVALVGIHRYNGDEINARLANSEADILNKAIRENVLNHEEIIRILTTRSRAQLMATLNHYKDDHGTSITKAKAKFFYSFITHTYTHISLFLPQKFDE